MSDTRVLASSIRLEPTWRHVHLVALTSLTAYAAATTWQAQLVSYPLYRAVGSTDFPAYHQAYNGAIVGVVIVPSFAAFLACSAFPWTRPAEVPRGAAWLVGLTGAGALLTTMLWAVPMHQRLDEIGLDRATIDNLIQANAVRTGLTTLGAVALGWSVLRSIRRRGR
jgi:hypothetical protein